MTSQLEDEELDVLWWVISKFKPKTSLSDLNVSTWRELFDLLKQNHETLSNKSNYTEAVRRLERTDLEELMEVAHFLGWKDSGEGLNEKNTGPTIWIYY